MAINQLIGVKISTLRSLKKIETTDLASKSGLSESQLEMIESGSSIPSLGVLIRISRALGVRLGTLLDDTNKEGPAIMRADAYETSLSFSTNESANREHMTFFSLAPNKTGRHMEPFIVDIEPSTGNPVTSSHEGEEFLFVLEGKITVYYGNEVLELEKGDSIYIDSIVKHLVTAGVKSRILGIVYIPV